MAIKLLDPRVISQIAAGEVVERPASVVKELVENSLDAGSTQVSVEAAGSGLGLIRVTDNGSGIPDDEVELAFERHATSKIRELSDLDSISSLGFRGEALPSIAAVARVEVLTCAGGEMTGAFLKLEDGAVVERRRQGRAQGTTVTVRNLFRRVPARLKFLKSPATENGRIAEVVTQYALAFPEVRFTLSIDDRVLLRSPGSGRLLDTVVEVYGPEAAGKMLELSDKQGEWDGGNPVFSHIVVTGLVGAPTVSRTSRGSLSFFVNRRWVSSRLLGKAVEDAYRGLLMQGRYPLGVVNISIPSAEVDVNIHPTKREVRFRDERTVFGSVQGAVRRTLVSLTPVPRIEEPMAAFAPPPVTTVSWESLVEGSSRMPAHAPVAQPLQAPLVALPVLRVMGQLSGSYIVAEGADGLYLIDQHAAHERVLFERVMEQRSKNGVEMQGLLEPATLEVEPKQAEAMKGHIARLAGFGFDIEPFGERTYLVRAVPALLHKKDWVGAIREVLDSASGNNAAERLAMSIACHSAVRAGQSMSHDEMRELVRELERVGVPHTCPHGRPTMIHLSLAQLSRDFGRTG
ncbi:MAG: DNA mismatch repair endonuclease MutL [Chloroflexi bacterium]|nr:DNA mismatch repair endonuclease MutL [Chloroflexota bacterium]